MFLASDLSRPGDLDTAASPPLTWAISVDSRPMGPNVGETLVERAPIYLGKRKQPAKVRLNSPSFLDV